MEGKLPELIERGGHSRRPAHAHDGLRRPELDRGDGRGGEGRGYAFLAITDHSKSQVIANGLTAERLLKHVAAIRKADGKVKGIKLLAGCEVDILVDGRMDFEDEVLKELDIVVASPHVSLKQDEAKATERCCGRSTTGT